ncbi:flotillin family protein [Pseudomonas putida]|uniref:Flotillin family protein n=1 Tax=Pseudomonas putida TaxID=303 RepID=A0A8I1EBM6_PSEPU|nr:flotillin family protein [Pseudomonas putida]MBI6882319.1 flotillin family protein [Pseudomonas putida]
MFGNAPAVMMWLIPVIIAIVIIMTILKNYKICPNDKVMVVYGAGSGSSEGASIVHGGGRLIIPFVQQTKFLSLAPMSITVDLTGALSANNIRVSVPSQFTVSIASKDPALMQNAVRYLLDQNDHDIQTNAKEIIFGSLRAVVATLTIEELTRDREKFIKSINDNVDKELNKIGMSLINVNIRDITDESGYITAMGQKSAASAINQANIDVAEQKRKGDVGVETNNRERDVTVAEQKTLAQVGISTAERDREVGIAKLQAETQKGTNESQASIADSNAELAVRQADAFEKGEVARAKAATEIAKQQRIAQQAELAKEQLPAAEVAKEQKVIEANANADQARIIAKGEADAIIAKFTAEAEGLKLVLEAKAAGYEKIVASVGGNTNAAATLLMIEKMAEIVEIQSQALANLHIDKITVWDSGSGNDGIQGFMRNFAAAMPPLHEIAAQAGVQLPAFMGALAKDPGALSLGAPAPAAEAEEAASEVVAKG